MSEKKDKKKKPPPWVWAIKIFIMTLVIAVAMSALSETVIRRLHIAAAFVVLLVIIAIGIAFDIIGIAVTAVDDTAFKSMAAKRIPGAKRSLKLAQNASSVSNLCNDVIGDICGIVSGAATGVILSRTLSGDDSTLFWMSIIFSAVTASITVGGKALGKNFAIERAQDIVFFVGKFLSLFNKDG